MDTLSYKHLVFRITDRVLIVWVYYTMTYMVSQQATDVWKAIKTAEILVQNYMVRIESCSADWDTAAAN